MENKSYDLEADLMESAFIADKVSLDDTYPGYRYKLYATLCNNEFIKNEIWSILQDKAWSCTWRYAGRIVANLVGSGDYMDYYCSGNEGIVDQEIKEDLLKLGWIVKSD